MTIRKTVTPAWSWPAKFGITAGRRIGDEVYLSGMLAMNADGELIAPGDAYEQTLKVFANIAEALESEGGSLADLAKMTTYLTDMSLYGDFKRARTEIFGDDPPASTAVVSPALALPGAVVEVEAMAVLSS